MNQSQKNFIDSYENMLNTYNEWGASLYEDIQELSINTPHIEFKGLEDGVNNYYAMSKIVGAKPTTEKWNFAQLRFVFKDKCKSVGYSDDSVLKLVSKLNLSEEVINLFKRG